MMINNGPNDTLPCLIYGTDGAGFAVCGFRCVQPALPRILGTSAASGKEQVAEVGKGVAQLSRRT